MEPTPEPPQSFNASATLTAARVDGFAALLKAWATAEQLFALRANPEAFPLPTHVARILEPFRVKDAAPTKRLMSEDEVAGLVRLDSERLGAMRAAGNEALALAPLFLDAGLDTRRLLLVKHCALDGGGGIRGLASDWRELRVDVDALALRLRTQEQGAAAARRDAEEPYPMLRPYMLEGHAADGAVEAALSELADSASWALRLLNLSREPIVVTAGAATITMGDTDCAPPAPPLARLAGRAFMALLERERPHTTMLPSPKGPILTHVAWLGLASDALRHGAIFAPRTMRRRTERGLPACTGFADAWAHLAAGESTFSTVASGLTGELFAVAEAALGAALLDGSEDMRRAFERKGLGQHFGALARCALRSDGVREAARLVAGGRVEGRGSAVLDLLEGALEAALVVTSAPMSPHAPLDGRPTNWLPGQPHPLPNLLSQALHCAGTVPATGEPLEMFAGSEAWALLADASDTDELRDALTRAGRALPREEARAWLFGVLLRAAKRGGPDADRLAFAAGAYALLAAVPVTRSQGMHAVLAVPGLAPATLALLRDALSGLAPAEYALRARGRGQGAAPAAETAAALAPARSPRPARVADPQAKIVWKEAYRQVKAADMRCRSVRALRQASWDADKGSPLRQFRERGCRQGDLALVLEVLRRGGNPKKAQNDSAKLPAAPRP